MKSRFIVCVLLLCLCFCVGQSAHSEESGVVEGTVTFMGEVPLSRVVDDAAQRRELLSVDRRTKGVRYVMVYLDRPGVKSDDPPKEQVIIDQIDHRFVPHLIAIQAGQSVKFTNSDAANHNVRAIALEERNTFNVYTGVGRAYEHTFYAQRRSYPIRLSCDIHPWMTAWIFVFEHPYFAVTDEKGRFRIANVAAGDHQMVVRQPDVGYLRRIDVSVEPGKHSKQEVRFTRAELKMFSSVPNGE